MSSPILHALTALDSAAVEGGQRAKNAKSSKNAKKSKTPDVFDFVAQGRFPVNALNVEVDGVGALEASMSPQQARALQQISTPSRFGRREKTLLDPAVRNSGEIAAEVVRLAWVENAFPALLRAVAGALGVERLEARLHNMLVYGPGQFFKPHQDTEKHPRMVATLVLIWPCAHIGGELQVRLDQRQERFVSQQLDGGGQIRWCAFYADCRHEVQSVEEGWRVALSFDLVLPEIAAAPVGAASPALLAAMRETFQPDAASQSRLTPWVFLLDHEYSEHGLRWPLLKGRDRQRAAALRAGAETLGLTMHLALAQVHQTWTAQLEAEPDELIEESLTLDFWVDSEDRVSSRKDLVLSPDTAESFTATGGAHLVDEEYEGYMGNYGETLDYWYRRAALVIESPMAARRTRFLTDFTAALAAIQARAKRPGDPATLAADVAAVSDILTGQVHRQGRKLLAAIADIAMALPDAQAGMALMANFDPADFTPADAKILARLERSRGTPWLLALLKTWTAPARRQHLWLDWGYRLPRGVSSGEKLTRPWPQPLEDFIKAGLKAGWSHDSLGALLRSYNAILEKSHGDLRHASPAQRLALHGELLTIACELASAIRLVEPEGDELSRELLALVSAKPALYPLDTLAPLLACTAPGAGTQALRERVVGVLRERLAAPRRDPADHALRGIEWQCRCKDCMQAVNWAESATGSPLELAMAEGRREHVSAMLAAAGAPVATRTLKLGSPYKLLLTKPRDLSAREQAMRERQQRDFDALA